tara:strand:+ start:443 stop:1432 length:990 start_codon:yes stop_codon:yes gene_type:complete
MYFRNIKLFLFVSFVFISCSNKEQNNIFDENSFSYNLDFNNYDIINSDSLSYQLSIDILDPTIQVIDMSIYSNSEIYDNLSIVNIDSNQVFNGKISLMDNKSFSVSFSNNSNAIINLDYTIPKKRDISTALFFNNEYNFKRHSFLFEKDFIVSDNFLYNEFEKYSFSNREVIVLCEIDNLSNQSIVEIQKFLLNGGFLVVFLSQNFEKNKDLIYSLGYPETKAIRGSSRNQFFPIENIDFVSKDFSGANPIFSQSEIYRYIELSQNERQYSNISFSNNDPLLIQKDILDGKAFFITTKLDKNWSNDDFNSALSDIIDRVFFQRMISNEY